MRMVLLALLWAALAAAVAVALVRERREARGLEWPPEIVSIEVRDVPELEETVLRVESAAAGRRLCRALEREGIRCSVTETGGTALPVVVRVPRASAERALELQEREP